MLRVLLSLSCAAALLACEDPAPPPAPPVVTPQVSALPQIQKLERPPRGTTLKLLGKHLDAAGIQVPGAPVLDAPAWARPEAKADAVVLADPKTGFELQLSQKLDYAKAEAHARKLAAESKATLHVDEPGALLLEEIGAEKPEFAVLVDGKLGEVRLLCRGPSLPSREIADQALAACKSLRLRTPRTK